MNKKFNPMLIASCVFIFILNSSTGFTTELLVKCFTPSDHISWDSFKNQLIDPNNFGPEGIELHFSFIIENVSEISAATLLDADIFIAGFSSHSDRTISYFEAQLLKEFVTRGGSLIVVSDTGFPSLNSANIIGSHFGSIYSVSGEAKASIQVVNRNIAPVITNGPFGEVNTLSWNANRVGKIVSEGNSKLIDNYGMLSVIRCPKTNLS